MSSPGRALRVLHLTSVEVGNYLLNNLVDHSDAAEVGFLAATLGGRGSFVHELERRGVATFALAVRSRRDYPRVLRELGSIAEREGIDVIHGHLFEPSLLAAWTAARRRIPLVVTRHHSDAVHRLRPRPRRWLYGLLERRTMRAAARIIAPSRMVRDVLTGVEKIEARRVVLVPYPQDQARFDAVREEDVRQARAELGMEGHLSLVYVARLHPEKGHPVLFEALARLLPEHPSLKVYLVGAGEERARLEAAARRLRLERHVQFLGWRDDALVLLAAADVVVHPSLHEALPSALIEAVALRRPVVASDVSGVRDILGDGEFGVIVRPADVESLRRGIIETLDDLPAARSRAASGRQHILSYMDPRRVALAHLSCYRAALLDRPGRVAGPG